MDKNFSTFIGNKIINSCELWWVKISAFNLGYLCLQEENTSLHWAAYSGSVDICEQFLNGGCTLDAPNEHGDRPLWVKKKKLQVLIGQ